MDKKCEICEQMNNSFNQFCQNCGHKFETNPHGTEKKNGKLASRHRLLILIIAAISITLVIVLVSQLFNNDQAGSNEIEESGTFNTENIEDSTEDLIIDDEPSEPEILFDTESSYHGELNGYKSYDNPNLHTYEKTYQTLEDLFQDVPTSSIPSLSDVLTKVDEPIVFYITDSFRDTTKANVVAVQIYHNNEVISYSFYPNNYSESHPETILTITDFIGKSVDEVIEIADHNQQKLFELTRDQIIAENQNSEDVVYQYSHMDYISPTPQPFELIFSDHHDGQIIKKYSQIQLENKTYESDLMNEQLESFNDYQVTYNLLEEDKYYSINMEHDLYLIGFKTNETAFITIYEDRYGRKIGFDHENSPGIDHVNVELYR